MPGRRTSSFSRSGPLGQSWDASGRPATRWLANASSSEAAKPSSAPQSHKCAGGPDEVLILRQIFEGLTPLRGQRHDAPRDSQEQLLLAVRE